MWFLSIRSKWRLLACVILEIGPTSSGTIYGEPWVGTDLGEKSKASTPLQVAPWARSLSSTGFKTTQGIQKQIQHSHKLMGCGCSPYIFLRFRIIPEIHVYFLTLGVGRSVLSPIARLLYVQRKLLLHVISPCLISSRQGRSGKLVLCISAAIHPTLNKNWSSPFPFPVSNKSIPKSLYRK